MQCLALSLGVFPFFPRSDCSAAKPQMQNSLEVTCHVIMGVSPLSLSLSLFLSAPSDCSAGWLASTAKPQTQNSPKLTDIPLVTSTKVTVSLVMTVVVFSVLWTSWWKTWQSAQCCPTCKILTKLSLKHFSTVFVSPVYPRHQKHAFCVFFLCFPDIKNTLSVCLSSVSQTSKTRFLCVFPVSPKHQKHAFKSVFPVSKHKKTCFLWNVPMPPKHLNTPYMFVQCLPNI